ncbi:T9SS type A sorting domain-containing protein [Flavobacterium capsici]|uniref:T9SS type A sorting domain-containing protein n=1 Tax=Flavobacterium capsici TaxID=3075618 RepID=A0AA96F386_9FLAO|nr:MULTISPECIES: T9SS type A sorting domain-containing protein [unclassified Flavobacterium]WNM17752.1 T9SS type A sorting domain-containing protein [Flavobacterium sp. PMR2A8]WNM21805.1 T9SS type A sorting domain-containing protein [Flavobacterium sp. PMTSA4]
MKTKLLSLLLTVMLYTGVTNAQTVWDFGNDTTNWPLDATGVAGNVVRSNLGIYMGVTSSSNIGIVENSPKVFPDGYSGTNRFKFNGAGFSSTPGFVPMPTQRYIYFATAGNCTVKIWFRTGGSGTRTLYVTDGTNVVGSFAGTDSAQGYYFESVYTGPATNLYIYGDQSNNLYKVEVVGTLATTTLSSSEFQASTVNVFSNGKQINVANVAFATQVNVYSITGALVKSINTSADVTINDLTAGFYIVNVKSAEGQKSVKVVVR